MRNLIKIFFCVVFCNMAYSQVKTLDYSTPKTSTVPFWNNDKQEIQDVVNNNSNILGELDDAIDLLSGASIRTIYKAVPVNSSVDYFSLTSTNGSFSIDIHATTDSNNFSVSKKINVTLSKGKITEWANVSGPDNGNDFKINYTNIFSGLDVIGFTASVQNLSATDVADVTLTIIVSGVLTPLIYTEL